jgi:hypothetical protein
MRVRIRLSDKGSQRSCTRRNRASPSLKPFNVVCTCRGFIALLGPGGQSLPLVTSHVALEPRSLCSTIITRFIATMDLSDSRRSPALILADRWLLWPVPQHCVGSPMLTPLSFAHIPPPLPRSSRKMLATLSSLPDFGLRFAPTFSTGTLGFSRLARRSIFIVVCTLADSLKRTFYIKGLNAQIALLHCLDCFRLERKLPGGLSSSHWI